MAQYEADDIIGTLDKLAEQDGFDIIIVSGDKDLIQADGWAVSVLRFPRKVCWVWGFYARISYGKDGHYTDSVYRSQGAHGDKSDNIPGVTKIGEKTGIKLLLEHGSLEGIYENIDDEGF